MGLQRENFIAPYRQRLRCRAFVRDFMRQAFALRSPWLVALAMLAGVYVSLWLLDRAFPLPLPGAGIGSTVVLASDGSPLRAFAGADGVWRYPVTLDQVSPLYIDALLTYEDRWFYHHGGINPLALLRSIGQGIWHRRMISGGSTLTMQVARILVGTPHTLSGKIRQMLRALQLEWHCSKDEILTLYLNHAPFGGVIEGVEAASWAYLGKSAQSLSKAEAALLTVLPQAPSRLRPDRHPERARRYRDKVLDRMASLGLWTPAQVHDARIEGVAARSMRQPMLAALLAERLHAEQPRQRRIQTTLDASLQRAMEARVSDYLTRFPDRTSAAVLVVDNASMAALAYVGSGAFGDDARLGHVDMVRAWRSPGSTLKPFLYGLALDDGVIHSESLLIDAPQSFGDYRPGNFDLAYNGPVGAAEALRLSLNVPAVDLLDRVGPVRFAARLANAGITFRLPRGVTPNLSVILGGVGVRMEDMVGAYAAFNRQGIAGTVRYRDDQQSADRRVLSAGASWIVRSILEANPRPGYNAATFDPGSRPPVAWKTGTSYGFRDAWAMGTTRRYTVGIWIGRPDGTPLPGQYGAITALPLLFQVIDSLPRAGVGDAPDAAPATVAKIDICWPLGLPPDPSQPQLCQRKKEAWTLDGVVPPTLPERDSSNWSSGLLRLRVDADSGDRLSPGCVHAHVAEREIARWPSLAYPWLDAATRRASSVPALASDCPVDGLDRIQTLHIDGIADHASIAKPPNSDKPPQLRLRALGAQGTVSWLVNQRLTATSNASQPVELSFPDPGTQTITALTDRGVYQQIEIRVLR